MLFFSFLLFFFLPIRDNQYNRDLFVKRFIFKSFELKHFIYGFASMEFKKGGFNLATSLLTRISM